MQIQKIKTEKQYLNSIKRKGEKLGSGAQGEVHLVIDKNSNILLAEKRIPDQEADQIRILIDLMEKSLANVGKIVDLYHLKSSNEIAVIMTKYSQTLDAKITQLQKNKKQFDKNTQYKIINQIITALRVLAMNQIFHRDIKPQNIMLDDEDNIYIIDFGLSKFSQQSLKLKNSLVGSPLYLSPLLYKAYQNGEKGGVKDDREKSDVYSAGLTILQVIDVSTDIQRITTDQKAFNKQFSNIDDEALAGLLQDMLQTQEAKRINSKECFNRLESVNRAIHKQKYYDDGGYSKKTTPHRSLVSSIISKDTISKKTADNSIIKKRSDNQTNTSSKRDAEFKLLLDKVELLQGELKEIKSAKKNENNSLNPYQGTGCSQGRHSFTRRSDDTHTQIIVLQTPQTSNYGTYTPRTCNQRGMLTFNEFQNSITLQIPQTSNYGTYTPRTCNQGKGKLKELLQQYNIFQ